MSIRTHILITLILLSTGIAVLVGWQSSRVATSAIEKRLVNDSVINAARLIAEINLPPSDLLMRQLATVLNCEMAAVSPDGKRLLAASLTTEQQIAELKAALPELQGTRTTTWIKLSKQSYRVGTARIPAGANRAITPTQPPHLIVLMPEARVRSARKEAALRIGILTVIAAAIASGIGFLLSENLSRPVRSLVQRMEKISEAVRNTNQPAAWEAVLQPIAAAGLLPPGTPANELTRLSASFNYLLLQLQDAQQRLDRAAKLAAGGQISAGVAHELRNPLSSIKMNARLLLDDPRISQNSRDSVRLIFNEIERMDLYLQELLALRPDTEADDISSRDEDSKPARLDEVADSILQLFADRARRSGIQFKRDYSPQAVLAAVAPASPLRQVVMNLVINALEAAPSNSDIEIVVSRPDADHVQLTVTDSGSGFDAALGDNVFEPFVTSKSRGTGLGLFICRRIIERYGGDIQYAADGNRNSIWFKLPAAADT